MPDGFLLCGCERLLAAIEQELQSLLAAQADVDLCRTWDGTPLHDAARFGLTRIAEMLISHRADVR